MCVCVRERDVKLIFFETWPRLEPGPYCTGPQGEAAAHADVVGFKRERERERVCVCV